MLMSCLASCIAANMSQDENSMTDSQSTPILSVFSQLAIFFSGFLIAVVAEPFRQWILKPVLELEFNKDSPDFVTSTPMTCGNAYYIRVKVNNKKRNVARGCKAYLVNIEKKQPNGEFGPTIYCDSLQLAWSNRGGNAYDGFDLSKGVNPFVDVITTYSDRTDFEPQIFPRTIYRYTPLFNQHGVFRFTIQISAENANPETIKIILDWSGKWDDFVVYEDN